MVITYKANVDPMVKIAEELRLIRAIMERQLRWQTSAEFVDYQMEKFGKDYKT